ncbi:polycystic kidney disease 1-like 2 [Labeo rohita]|uniref:Polycystic kidney disease 1-like 2 n=1 Tax=Labeo rohita TaxID=84645 RepID=A0A498MF58_LABRO|nr:polycystic kidney disease 1-like 2 [Labeo rohita]
MKMNKHTLYTLFLIVSFHVISIWSDDEEVLFCPENQQAFESSCYEFVVLQRSFLSAQAWCERGGGHLAFIQNEETQQFLQKHLQPEQDWWIGLAPVSTNLTLDSAATEGPLSWLDGSDVSYSNWLHEPWLNASCSYIRRDSGFQWETTTNCSQELFFICEFESGRSLACTDHNATLQCGSGQVIEIDDSFYGRKTVHYCRSSHAPSHAIPQQEECSWVDIVDTVSEHCHGLQVCQAAADISSFGEPCPVLRSYLSVEYHCKDALHLLMSKLAAVFDNITITVKWLLHPFQGNLTCTLNAGDGHVIDNYSPEEMENVVHKYSHAGMYTVMVECSTSEWHVSAYRSITIQEPLGEFGTIKCHSMNQSTDYSNCKAHYNNPLRIQVELDAGTNVTYKIQHGNTELASTSTIRGIIPHNITISPEVQQQLGPGCHQLTVVALNGVTAVDRSTVMELCLVEPVEGLTVDVEPEHEQCPVHALYVNVSLAQGAPVQLHFLVSGPNHTFSEMHEMLHGSPQVFVISNTIKGELNVVVRAENSFSSMEMDGGNTTVYCHNETVAQHEEDVISEDVRTARAINLKITVDPEVPVIGTTSVKLYVDGLEDDSAIWKCTIKDSLSGSARYTVPIVDASSTEDSSVQPLLPTTVFPSSQTTDKSLNSATPPIALSPPSCIITPLVGNYFYCGAESTVESLYLPLGDKHNNYSLMVDITVKNAAGVTADTAVTARVKDTSSNHTVGDLQALVSNQVSKLQQQGRLTGAALAQMFQSVSDRLNDALPEGQHDSVKKQLRQQMLLSLSAATNSFPPKNPAEVQMSANVVVGLTTQGHELTDTAQLQASYLLANLSKSLVSLTHSGKKFSEQILQASTPIIDAVSNIFKVSSSTSKQNEVSNRLLNTVDNVQSALLVGKKVNQEPTILRTSVFGLYVNRISSDGIQKQPFSIQQNSSASFILPSLGPNVLFPDEPVDVRMTSFGINPFSWHEGEHISGSVGSLSLTKMNGSVIPVANLTEEIEILLPRTEVAEVNQTLLELANFSTVVINVTAPNISLVFKLHPSEETPLQLFLGFQDYPNDTNYEAQIQLPQDGDSEEERYTWVLNPMEMTVEVGVYYLLVRPVVGAGVHSTNVSVFITTIAAHCLYWDETKGNWSGDGCRVKVTVLEDNDPLAEYRYLLSINTGHRRGASTSSQVTVTLQGTEGESEPHHVTDPEKPVFERGGLDMFLLTTPCSLGELQSIRLWHDNSGQHPAWYVNKIMVQDLETGQKWHFLCNSWLSIDLGECTLDKVFPVATEMDLKRFSNLFFMKTAKDFRDGHIWFSVISRPPSSNFTRVQRVSCCFSLLLCTMLTSIMFWGIPSDPSEQTMDLGQIEFTWQQVMIGIQSSIIMFPINLLIVSIFRNARPREQKSESSSKQQSKTDPKKQGKTGRVSPDQTSHSDHKEITPDTDIKRIAQSLYKVMRRPVPRIELDSTKADINKMLSLVEEIIRQHNRVGNEFYSDSSKKEQSFAASLECVNLKETTFCESSERNEKHSTYSQYLYKQLQNVERELRLLGPSSFFKPDSYNQAVLQVQGMKNLLEPHVSSCSVSGLHTRSSSPIEGSSGNSKKCCQKGLPWWFVFVGWFLVLATSGVSAYFTMMYGLTYGKERSISWLISMVVSFFESLFITQPVKVLGFAVFFALVLKTVDQEDYGDVPIDGTLPNADDPDAIRIARRDSTCSFYQPPPPTDIEKMRNNMIKEQKVFALIREILIYVGFLWMLLLVAYGQRDPNAYYLTHHIRQSFSNGISETMNHKDILNWAKSSLLSNLFGQYPGFITDGNSKLVGNARLRQVRVKKDSCKIAKTVQYSVPDCHAPYSWEAEDMGSYSPGWNRTKNVNGSKTVLTPWHYQTQAKLRANPVWGGLALYKGGGYVVELGPDQKNASSLLQYLFNNIWLDVYTRAVFVEFTVYNANVNLFCIVTLIFETTGVGAFQYRSEVRTVHLYQSTGGFHVFVMASEAIYFLFILYYMFVQGKLMKQQKWAYFRSKWNVLELAIIILSWSALSVFVKRTILGNRDIEYYQNNKDMFASFNETATADAVLGYLIAFLVLLATIKLWHLLRLNPKLHMITSTLQRAWTDISGFIVVMTIMFLAYSIACNLMYGWRLYSYRTLLEAAQTIICLQLGIFNYDEVLDYNPVLGAFLIGSCIIFMTFVVLNLFISPSEEEEIVDLMLMKICSLLGIKCKKKLIDADASMTTASVIS